MIFSVENRLNLAKRDNLSKNVPSTHLNQRFRSFTIKKEKNQEKTQKEKKAKNTKKEKKSRKNQRHDIFCREQIELF